MSPKPTESSVAGASAFMAVAGREKERHVKVFFGGQYGGISSLLRLTRSTGRDSTTLVQFESEATKRLRV
jgi:hypothetical protein